MLQIEAKCWSAFHSVAQAREHNALLQSMQRTPTEHTYAMPAMLCVGAYEVMVSTT